jgi:hypothetical protein
MILSSGGFRRRVEQAARYRNPARAPRSDTAAPDHVSRNIAPCTTDSTTLGHNAAMHFPPR